MNEKNESSARSTLENIVVPSLELKAKDLAVFHEKDVNTLVLRLEKNPALANLHQKVIDALRKYICWEETPPILAAHEQDNQRKSAYANYGIAFYGDFYQMHISIAQFSPSFQLNEDDQAVPEISWCADTFDFAKREISWQVVRSINFTQKR